MYYVTFDTELMWYCIETGLQNLCVSGTWCPPMILLTGKHTWKQGDICKQYLQNKYVAFMRNVNWNCGNLSQMYQFVPYIHVKLHNWYRAAQQFMLLTPHYGTELRHICYKMCWETECDGFVWTCCNWNDLYVMAVYFGPAVPLTVTKVC